MEKLNGTNYRRPLSFANRVSETQEMYQPPKKPDTSNKIDYLASFHKLEDHNKQIGPLVGDGLSFYVRNGDVFNLNNPYVTTNSRAHRAFGPEEYDFARGLGVASAPPKAQIDAINSKPPERQEPMRDTMEFLTGTKIGPVRHPLRSVPHKGLSTETRDNMKWPSHPRMRENYYSDVDCHCNLPNGGPGESAVLAPATYCTEYQNIGSRRVAVV